MILDNENEHPKVHEWIAKYTQMGELSIVTGYFTIGAIAYISEQTNNVIDSYRFILGDIVHKNSSKERALDLLNENISVDASLKLSSLAKEAVKFLELEKIEAKTMEPNFCHAKLYLFKSSEKDAQKDYYISGSSNLTEAGIGLKPTNNIELNIGSFGSDPQYKDLLVWFNDLWKRPQAHKYKTIVDEDGKEQKIPFKLYLIEEIKKIFKEYSPRELYYKVLFELFGEELLMEKDNPEFNRQIGRLENTVIFNTLYEFQQKAVLSLIKMLQKYNGAILADAVGLGKTWTALGVMKFYQLQGREVILMCPKKLQHNWRKFLKNQESKFEKDNFEYFVRFHTDMQEERLEKYFDRADSYFTNEKPKLLVIDESHNLRNDKSKRYKFLVDEILKRNEDLKVLMLSATPINNSLIDIRNQFKLIVAGDIRGFEESLDVRNLDYTFRAAQRSFNDWTEDPHPRIGELIKKLPSNFFKITDSLTVARTRKMIEEFHNGFQFPFKEKPENIFITPRQIGNFESFEELFDHFPPMLSAYQPAFYLEEIEDVEKIYDERQRDRFLVKMMYILMVKRLESSWFAFYSTVRKILDHHQNALDRIKHFEKYKKDLEAEESSSQINVFDDDDDIYDKIEEYTLGKRRKILLADIDRSGNLSHFKRDIKKDIDALELLLSNLSRFSQQMEKEKLKPRNHSSVDDKLETLMDRIIRKRKIGANNGNQKVLIFTAYRDTAVYLFEQLKARGFINLAVVSGDSSKSWDADHETKNFEPILERFVPFTKLFNEKEWDFEPSSPDLTMSEQYEEWLDWLLVKKDDKTLEKLNKPIDILIATDALSEGQNLQDCDMVMNYDIHWNPVRVVQRVGRIDRLGSPNESIFGINFWPSNNINTYLNLQGRIEQRMTAMKLAGSEVNHEFSDTFKEMAESETLEQKQNKKMLQQMEISWNDIEVSEQNLGFDDLSLETYRQELLEELRANEKLYRNMPNGIYTGFKTKNETCPGKGVIALMGYPSRTPNKKEHQYKSYELIYVDEHGSQVLQNQKEILEGLAKHKLEPRFVPAAIDHGGEEAIKRISDAIGKWLKSQAVEEEVREDGTVKEKMGKASLDLINKIKGGSKAAIEKIKSDKTLSKRYSKENFDLINWFVVTD